MAKSPWRLKIEASRGRGDTNEDIDRLDQAASLQTDSSAGASGPSLEGPSVIPIMPEIFTPGCPQQRHDHMRDDVPLSICTSLTRALLAPEDCRVHFRMMFQ